MPSPVALSQVVVLRLMPLTVVTVAPKTKPVPETVMLAPLCPGARDGGLTDVTVGEVGGAPMVMQL